MSRRNRLYAEMREQMAKTMKAMKDIAMEPFAMLGKGSLPQLSIRSPTRAVAEDDDDIKRYASTWNNKEEISIGFNLQRFNSTDQKQEHTEKASLSLKVYICVLSQNSLPI